MANDTAIRPPEKVINDIESQKSKIDPPATINFINKNKNDKNNKKNDNSIEEKKQKNNNIETDISMAKTPQN